MKKLLAFGLAGILGLGAVAYETQMQVCVSLFGTRHCMDLGVEPTPAPCPPPPKQIEPRHPWEGPV